MGAQLSAYYDKAKEKGGLSAQVKLAMFTKMSSTEAASADDSPANVKAFDEAFAKLVAALG